MVLVLIHSIMKIFGVFQKLHGKDIYEGIGIVLQFLTKLLKIIMVLLLLMGKTSKVLHLIYTY